MKCRGWPMVVALALAGCGDDEAAAPERAIESAAPAPAAEVTGPERRVLAFGDSLFAGYRVEASESYPARLEATLRGQGHNVRVINGGVSRPSSTNSTRCSPAAEVSPETPALMTRTL